MTKELIIERLSYVKYLYQLGEQQTQQPNRIAFSSILSFHDAIDLFNHLAAEYLRKTDAEKKAVTGGKDKNPYMMQYFDLIPELTLKSSVKKINDRRNSLKHNGEIPSAIGIEESKVVTKLFLEENTERIFKLDFNEVSLLNLIEKKEVAVLLKDAEKYLLNKNFIRCSEEVAKAFYVLTFIDSRDYSGDRYGHYYKNRLMNANLSSSVRNLDGNLERVFRQYNDNFRKINESFLIISLGIDYRKYIKFEQLTPEVQRSIGNSESLILTRNRSADKLNNGICKFLIDFVLECALKIQTFEYK